MEAVEPKMCPVCKEFPTIKMDDIDHRCFAECPCQTVGMYGATLGQVVMSWNSTVAAATPKPTEPKSSEYGNPSVCPKCGTVPAFKWNDTLIEPKLTGWYLWCECQQHVAHRLYPTPGEALVAWNCTARVASSPALPALEPCSTCGERPVVSPIVRGFVLSQSIGCSSRCSWGQPFVHNDKSRIIHMWNAYAKSEREKRTGVYERPYDILPTGMTVKYTGLTNEEPAIPHTTNEKLRARVKELQDKLSWASNDLKAACGQRDKLEKRVNELEKSIQDRGGAIYDIINARGKVDAEIAALKRQLAAVVKQRDEAVSKEGLADMADAWKLLKAQRDASWSSLAACEKDRDTARSLLETVTKQRDEAVREAEEHRARYGGPTNEFRQMRQERDNAVAELARIRSPESIRVIAEKMIKLVRDETAKGGA